MANTFFTNVIHKLRSYAFGKPKTKVKTKALRPPKLKVKPGALVVNATAQGIDPALVSPLATQTVATLQKAGFEAYIVGGAVRDLLLGLRPKDFDVATDATPEEVKALFRRAFIIGRRFRLVHVVFGHGREAEVIEVSTFRAQLDASQSQRVHGNEKNKAALARMAHAVDGRGRVLRDNVWGSQAEDAERRDFSINALYYDPIADEVLDYHQGLQDLQARQIRLIGDPATRYREDPVRIIRAVRFLAKLGELGFTLEAKTQKPMVRLKTLLKDVPPSRLFDEVLKLLQTGHALQSLSALDSLGLHGIDSLLDTLFDRAETPLVRAALLDTDSRIAQGKPVLSSFLLACVFWQDVKRSWTQHKNAQPPLPLVAALHAAMEDVLNQNIGDISGRGKLASDMREIWALQVRFEKRQARPAANLLSQPRFRAALNFLRLRAQTAEENIPADLPQWWENFWGADEVQRQVLIESAATAIPKATKSRSRSGSSRRRSASSGNSATSAA